MKQHSFIVVVVILVGDLFLPVCVSLSHFLIHHLLDLQDNFCENVLKSRTDIYDIKYEARSFTHIHQNNVIIQYVYVNLFWTSIPFIEVAFGVFYLDDIVATENASCVSSVPVLPNCALHL